MQFGCVCFGTFSNSGIAEVGPYVSSHRSSDFTDLSVYAVNTSSSSPVLIFTPLNIRIASPRTRCIHGIVVVVLLFEVDGYIVSKYYHSVCTSPSSAPPSCSPLRTLLVEHMRHGLDTHEGCMFEIFVQLVYAFGHLVRPAGGSQEAPSWSTTVA